MVDGLLGGILGCLGGSLGLLQLGQLVLHGLVGLHALILQPMEQHLFALEHGHSCAGCLCCRLSQSTFGHIGCLFACRILAGHCGQGLIR
uniref:IP10626p n=1 Tax=Drosophila melanogaster TaxID=7227 RepID=Q4V3R5_DROME|nr:IP10726p [Drosophila melanogaster]AAY55707.1 IP10626p [Drosophila melanogaster]